MSSEDISSVLERALDECGRGCFTGLLRVRTLEGEGHIRFLSGIQDGVEFDSAEGDEALRQLLSASEPLFEAVPTLPPIDQGEREPVPVEGGLTTTFPAARLMRYCESNSLTCSLELESAGQTLTARYRLGELLSVDPDSEQTAQLADAKEGNYRFRLPKFSLTDSVPQARYSEPANGQPQPAAKAAAAPQPAPAPAPPRAPRRAAPRPQAPERHAAQVARKRAAPEAEAVVAAVAAPEAQPSPPPPVASPVAPEPEPIAAQVTAKPAAAAAVPPLDLVIPAEPVITASSPAASISSTPAARPSSLNGLWGDAKAPPPQDAPLELGLSLSEPAPGDSGVAELAPGLVSLKPGIDSPAGAELDSVAPRAPRARARYWVALILIGGIGLLAWLVASGRVILPDPLMRVWHDLSGQLPQQLE